LDLTREQLEAAEACGCALLPATEAQVGRLTPQRRIFRLDGRPFVARRPDGFLETHATLARLIEDRLRRTAPTPPPPRRGAPVAATEQTATADAARIRQPSSSDGPAESVDTPPPPPPPPTAPGPDATAASGTHDAAAPATEAEPVPARGGGRGTVRGVRRRAGQPKPPRWTTADALRRGRPPTPR
jgi:hypothetical protein